MMCIILFSCLCLISAVLADRPTLSMEGYPMGFMSDCPGSQKKAYVSKRSLRHLTLTVQGPGGMLAARRKLYTYHQLRDVVRDRDVDFGRKTAIYVGGYMDSVNFPLSGMMMKAYKDLGYNALTLDVSWFSTVDYPVACRYMRPVGMHAAQMIANLTELGLDPKRLELVGLSLGAQTMGYISKHYRAMTGKSIAKLIAMDPAGPCFRNLGPHDRLDSTDADLVVMIGTNIDYLGMATPLGHVNFYVNGGENQPGDLHLTACFTVCSHVRSFFIWISALQHPNKFVGLKCDSVKQARRRECYDRVPLETNVLGQNTDRNNPGIFYLATDNVYPYFLGKKGLRRENEFWSSHLKAYNDVDVLKA